MITMRRVKLVVNRLCWAMLGTSASVLAFARFTYPSFTETQLFLSLWIFYIAFAVALAGLYLTRNS